MKRLMLLLLLVPMVLMMSGCPSTSRGEKKVLDNTLNAFGSEFRWGEDLERIFAYFDPEEADKLRPKQLEVERWKQYRVIGFREQPVVMLDEGLAQQRAEIELVNRHTQVTRSIRIVTEWKYEKETERWYLKTPLPTLGQ